MKSLCEMDREYELREAKAATIKENHLKLINDLTGLGYSKQEVIDFLTTYAVTEAE
jgi:DNA-binding transcriptional regulator YhcF (GntR family)